MTSHLQYLCLWHLQPSSTTACTPLRSTSAPPSPLPLNPLPIYVTNANYGYAAGSFTYQYVDLWSRRSTWGGNLPPIDGDSVYIPAGATVMLDVSPPRLYLLIVEGNLVFDSNVNANIWLQVSTGSASGVVGQGDSVALTCASVMSPLPACKGPLLAHFCHCLSVFVTLTLVPASCLANLFRPITF